MINSVLIAKIVILWVSKLIHNNIPMYAVLDKDTIKMKYCLIYVWPNVVS